MKISVVIPVYNESENIKAVIQELMGVIKSISEVNDFEIIVVDDHSSDDTLSVVGAIDDTRVKCLRLSKQCGSHIALRAGIANSAGDAMLYISADGQDNPSCVKDLLSKWRNGAGVVWALRKNRKNEAKYVRIPAEIFYRLIFWLSGTSSGHIDLSRADFFLLDRKVINAINECPERNASLFGLLMWLGFNQDSVEYDRRSRQSGKSKWTFKNRLHLAKDWIVAFSGLPLKLMSYIGIGVAVLGFIYGLYIVTNAILGNPVPGWSSIMVAIFVLGGIQMMMLGIMGEYLWRNLDESRKRPLYFVERETVSGRK